MSEEYTKKITGIFQCPLCGYASSAKGAAATCDTYIFRKHCGLVVCPKCRHGLIPDMK